MACPSEIALMCRLCLLKDKQQVNIPIFEDHSDSKLLVKISALLPIKIFKEDQLPKNICDGCSDKLNLLYEFWNVSLESERTLLSWLKNDNLTISALAEPIEETIVKEEVEVEDESPYLDLAQHSSMDEFQEAEEEDVEEPPSKRPRRLAAMKAGISIATVSDDDNYEDGPQTEDVVKLEFESDENDNSEDIAKLENESDNDISSSVPENSTHESHDQPGPSGLGKSGTETPMLRKRAQWSGEDLRSALQAIANGMSIKGAAKKYKIPRSTLGRHHRTQNSKRKLGRSPVLSAAQENELVGRIHRLAEEGMPITNKILMKSVFSYATTNHIPNPFSKVSNRGGRKWLKLFLSRHPDVSRLLELNK